MPIYEFYCAACHTIFNFYSRSVNTEKRPDCPKCGRKKLERRVSAFSAVGHADDDAMPDLPVDEGRMEKAVERLASEAENIDENDPRQAARLMRRFSDMTGMELGRNMEEAIGRMEAGEDPDRIEAEMGDMMEDEDPFVLPGEKGGRRSVRDDPRTDPALYDM